MGNGDSRHDATGGGGSGGVGAQHHELRLVTEQKLAAALASVDRRRRSVAKSGQITGAIVVPVVLHRGDLSAMLASPTGTLCECEIDADGKIRIYVPAAASLNIQASDVLVATDGFVSRLAHANGLTTLQEVLDSIDANGA